MRFLPLLAVACAYEAPTNTVSAPPILNAVTGTILFAGAGEVTPTFVTVFDANNPGPPAGTGQPVTFSSVPAEAYSIAEAGLRSAPFSVTHLADGSYLLNALMDSDGDFNPFSAALAGATCGDWGGAYLADLTTGTPAPVALGGGQLVDDITIIVGQQFTVERPAFRFSGTPQLALGAILRGEAFPLFRLRTTSVLTAFSPEPAFLLDLGPACAPSPLVPDCQLQPGLCPCDVETLAPCGTALWVWMKDVDADGVVDPYPAPQQAAAGLLDIWPRVYLEYAGELEPFDYDGRTVPERWVTQAFPLAGEIAVGAAGPPEVPAGLVAGAFGPVGVPFPANELSVTFAPVFVHYHAAGAFGEDVNGPFDILDLNPPSTLPASTIPAGPWAVTVVSFTGQTWTLPNDIGLLGLPSLDPSFDAVAQGAVMDITTD